MVTIIDPLWLFAWHIDEWLVHLVPSCPCSFDRLFCGSVADLERVLRDHRVAAHTHTLCACAASDDLEMCMHGSC